MWPLLIIGVEMTRSAEKNDIDITQLFKYEKEVVVEDILAKKSVTVYMRLMGDADLNRARVYGLRKSADMRKELRKKGSDLRQAFLSEFVEFPAKDTLIMAILLLQAGQIRQDALNNTDVPEPKRPKGDATLEKLEEYQTAVDAYEKEYDKALNKEMTKVEKRERREHEKREEKDLYIIYEGLVIDRLCSQEMAEQYFAKCVFFSTYKDPKHAKKTFSTFSEFENLAPAVRTKLVSEYQNLELGLDELKKLHEATD